jgi:hypothetical protein
VTRADLFDLDSPQLSPGTSRAVPPHQRHHRMQSRRLADLTEKWPGLHGYGGVLAVVAALLVAGATVIALSSRPGRGGKPQRWARWDNEHLADVFPSDSRPSTAGWNHPQRGFGFNPQGTSSQRARVQPDVTRADLFDLDSPQLSPGTSRAVPPHQRHHRMQSRRLADLTEKWPGLHGYGGVLAVLAALIVVGATVIALSSQARDQVALSFVRQPEKYTELYFSRDGPTQASFSRDWVLVKVSFTVVNHEGEMTSFPYVVQVVNDADALLGRAHGSLDLADESSLTPTVAVVIPATEAWAAVDVDLEGRSQHIRFLRTR